MKNFFECMKSNLKFLSFFSCFLINNFVLEIFFIFFYKINKIRTFYNLNVKLILQSYLKKRKKKIFLKV